MELRILQLVRESCVFLCVIEDCHSPTLRLFKSLLTAESSLTSQLISFIETPGPPPLGSLWHVRPAVTQTFPDPVAAGGRAHRPTTTAHYSETLKGGLGGCGGRWGGGGQTGRGGGALLWHSSPLFPLSHSCWPTSTLSTLRYIDPDYSTGSQ